MVQLGQDKVKARKSRDETTRREEHLAQLERAHQRLQHLHGVGKVLSRFQSVEGTIPEVLAVVAGAIALRSALFMLGTGGRPRIIAWPAAGGLGDPLPGAEAHARAAYGYLVRSRGGPDGDATTSASGWPPALGDKTEAAASRSFVMLPLVVDHGAIFGALQIEGLGPLGEDDLIFADAVVNQLAIAVDRQAAVSARQAGAEASEREQRILADASAALGSSLDPREALEALVKIAVPYLADVCLIDEVGDDGTVQRVEVLFADQNKQRSCADRLRRFAPRPGWQTPQAKAIALRQAFLFSTIVDPFAEGFAHDQEHADAMLAAGFSSMMVVPLVARDRTLGALTFAAAESGRRYTPRDLALAVEIAHRAATAIDHAGLYQQAQRATRAREDLLAVVSHDLKSPLYTISMNVVMLQRAREGDDRGKALKRIAAIQRSADRMNRLIEDLLDAASIEAGRLSVEPQPLAVMPLVSELIEGLQALSVTKGLRLVSELPAELPAIQADCTRLQQVLVNLVGNAIKFTPEGGSITVRARPSGDSVTFSVSDTGAGIAEADIPHLFDRFWQAKSTARLGTGLGLFIVKGIVEAHGGSIWVESTVGGGSTFSFTLGLARPGAEPLGAAAAAAASEPGVLLAEIAKQGADIEEIAQDNEKVRKRELCTAIESTRVARALAEGASELKRDFMSVVSHELRGPLTALELLLERLQRDRESPLTAGQDRLVCRMFATVGRLTTIVESLLQHALIRSGRLTTQIEDFHPLTVAAEVVEEMRPCAEEKGVQLRLVAAKNVPSLRSDALLVRLILLNLVGNAMKFTKHGLVQIAIDGTDGAHHLIVSDSGPGISAADRVRIFEPFVQMGDAKQAHAPGMGLGLTLVREVVSALGGLIELESEVGWGSAFTVTLPSAPEAGANEVLLH